MPGGGDGAPTAKVRTTLRGLRRRLIMALWYDLRHGSGQRSERTERLAALVRAKARPKEAPERVETEAA